MFSNYYETCETAYHFFQGDAHMLINELRKTAKIRGIKIARDMKKDEIIRAIQKHEGNFPCFGTAQGYCSQEKCFWRQDCLGKKITL